MPDSRISDIRRFLDRIHVFIADAKSRTEGQCGHSIGCVAGKLVFLGLYVATVFLPVALVLFGFLAFMVWIIAPEMESTLLVPDAVTPSTEVISAEHAVAMPDTLDLPVHVSQIISGAPNPHDIYDSYFVKYTKRYFGPLFDWRWFKAQAMAESNMNADARSRRGARGLMQVMPRTFHEIRLTEGFIGDDISMPEWSIAAGIAYDRGLWNKFAGGSRSLEDRLSFTFGAYNAGFTSILNAQRIAVERKLNPYRWDSIARALPEVTGRKSGQTIAYVNKIHRYKRRL
jgi:hypothetical protein